ncbi:AraC family transcriptional regulator [Leptospira semungkisensis]|uniref:AraC family transcriptional regulator n=2 Tax=Leptospira semungkisensis TaxID=2484985 RepID=A0A4R9FMV7_9LEPT|nr:AraC family transcriptional regulator [Leptospira semungkisensis]
MRRYSPSEFLKPFVQTYLIIESHEELKNTLIPGSSVVLFFKIRGSVSELEEGSETRTPLFGLSGLRRKARIAHYSKNSSMLLVLFKEGGASSFFREPMHEIFGMGLSMENFMQSSKVQEIEEKLLEAKTDQERISRLESILVSEWRGSGFDPLIRETIRRIRAAKGDLRIADLVKGMPISRDSLEKKFRQIIGTSPKQYAGIIRMRNLIDSYSPEKSLTETAIQAGFFDQAHFIKDFKIFTGQTPKEFFKSPSPRRFW